jgi:hypothetical protein
MKERTEAPLASARDIGNYQYIDNCLDDAFATAVRTLNDRIAKYTPVGAEAQDWVRAQDAVFANCRGEIWSSAAGSPLGGCAGAE